MNAPRARETRRDLGNSILSFFFRFAHFFQQYIFVYEIPDVVGSRDNSRFFARIPFRVFMAILATFTFGTRFIQI
jgi:hypothetical protein